MGNLLEIACFDFDSARMAAAAGAHRIEFCDGLSQGGTTPFLNEAAALLKSVAIPVFVMIRPRGGNFVYSQTEFEQMQNELMSFKSLGVHGFVFGILDEQNRIDPEKNKILVQLAFPLPCTFHRAFDLTVDLEDSLEKLIGIGFKRVLTSGGKGNAPDNVEALTQLVKKASGRIGILPGGGVRSGNIKNLLVTGAAEFHSSGIVPASHPRADVAEIKKILDEMA